MQKVKFKMGIRRDCGRETAELAGPPSPGYGSTGRNIGVAGGGPGKFCRVERGCTALYRLVPLYAAGNYKAMSQKIENIEHPTPNGGTGSGRVVRVDSL